MTETAHYGLWRSPISIESIFRQPAAPAYPCYFSGRLYWLQALPEEGGRVALMVLEEDGAQCLTPQAFNIRSRVHEYGGKCFCLLNDSIVFNNYVDNRLYRQVLEPGAVPEPITNDDRAGHGFVDLVASPAGDFIVAVSEKSEEGAENRNHIVAVNMERSSHEPQILISGRDFYAAPAISPDGDQIIWIEWDHPNMPWDHARLCKGKILFEPHTIGCLEKVEIFDQPDTSVCQPGFLEDGSIVYARDDNEDEWWNLYRFVEGTEVKLTEETAEFGEAHWQFGQTRWVQTGKNSLAAIATSHSGDRLLEVRFDEKRKPEALFEEAAISQLDYEGKKLVCIVMTEDRPGQIAEVNTARSCYTCIGPRSTPMMEGGHSAPVPVQCATSDGERTWGYYYPPHNPEYAAPENELPPLVMMVHGGPTGRTNKAFHPLRQYFTSLGFAVFDINHRGSTGYGRRYRQRLLGGWGVIDCMDIADSVDHLISERVVEGRAVFIRGGSAGGYAVLRALTCYPGLFAGGACYYGIGNLITLCEITHKFESKYTDNLIGEIYNPVTANSPQSRYVARSPIFAIQKLISPLILFQGLKDKVVPPEVSMEVVRMLEMNKVPYQYTEYENEGHGFRTVEARIDSLEKETRFFQKIIEKLHTN